MANLLSFIQSHGFEAAIDGDAVVFLVPASLNGETCRFGEWARVSTVREARDALGY